MARRTVRAVALIAAVAGAIWALSRVLHRRDEADGLIPAPVPWPPLADPQPETATEAAPVDDPTPAPAGGQPASAGAAPATPAAQTEPAAETAETAPNDDRTDPPTMEMPAVTPPAPPLSRRRSGRQEPAWVEPGDGRCPDSHPIKVKLSSRLFHLPGMSAYERTSPDRCYRSGETAEADGFTRAKR